jgi:hypothetical protein
LTDHSTHMTHDMKPPSVYLLFGSLWPLFATADNSLSDFSSIRDDDHRLGNAPPGQRYCTAAPTPDSRYLKYVCSENPIETLGLEFGDSGDGMGEGEITIGVPQRIDGTEAERLAIRKILEQTDEYFHREVLSMPEYASIRARCKNRNELCSYWYVTQLESDPCALSECSSSQECSDPCLTLRALRYAGPFEINQGINWGVRHKQSLHGECISTC